MQLWVSSNALVLVECDEADEGSVVTVVLPVSLLFEHRFPGSHPVRISVSSCQPTSNYTKLADGGWQTAAALRA